MSITNHLIHLASQSFNKKNGFIKTTVNSEPIRALLNTSSDLNKLLISRVYLLLHININISLKPKL